MENQILKSIPGDQCGPIKKPNHGRRNNLEKVSSFCSVIKNPEYYVPLTATVETGSRFHTPSKVISHFFTALEIYSLNIQILYYLL